MNRKKAGKSDLFLCAKCAGLVPREFLCLGFDFGDSLCAAFVGIFVGEDDVHENGTRDNGVDMLAEHLGLFAVADAETAEHLGAVLADRVEEVKRSLVNDGLASGSACAECGVDVLETCRSHRFEAFLGHRRCCNWNVFKAVFFAGCGESFVAVEWKVRNDACRNASFLAHLDEVFDTRRKGEGTVGHDVNWCFGVACVNFAHDFKPLLGGKSFVQSDCRCRLDGRTICARIAEGKLYFEDGCTALHKSVCDGDGRFRIRETRN